jgi:xylan 1,4-beta-xylosidase
MCSGKQTWWPWEAKLVEGVAMMRQGEYIYAFYAAAGCCGNACTYGVGVARAKNLLGPWEKYEKNPVMTSTEQWKCPGHGTPIEKDGKFYFLHHAYSARGSVYTGREGILSEFKFTPDGWIEFVNEVPPATISKLEITDPFKGKKVSDKWQWSVFQDMGFKQRRGRLTLGALPTATGAFLGQKTYDVDYVADALVLVKKSNATAGLGAIGDEKNVISVQVKEDMIKVVLVQDGKETEVMSKQVEKNKKLYLRMQVRNGKNFLFFYSTNGKDFYVLNTTPIDGGYLPPWDRAIRAGLISKGAANEKAVFDSFEMKSL